VGEKASPGSAARGWEEGEGVFASFSSPAARLHAGGTPASPSHGPDAGHCFSSGSSAPLGAPAIRLQAALCFGQCWTWHALRRGRLRGSAARRGTHSSSRTQRDHVHPGSEAVTRTNPSTALLQALEDGQASPNREADAAPSSGG